MERSSLFGNWNFYRSVLAIAVPIMVQQLIQSLVSLVDNFMVAGLGDVAMSGVNIANQILFIFMIFLNTINISGGIYLTQFFGARDRGGMQQAFRFKIFIGLLALIPFFIICIIFPRPVLSLMVIGNTEADAILDQGVTYMRMMSLTGFPMIMSMCMASSLKDLGRVRPPLIISAGSALINTLFNWILIYGHLGAPALGIKGAAIATIIARTTEFVLYSAVCVKGKPLFVFNPRLLLSIDTTLLLSMLRKTGMVLISEMTWVLSETITTAVYNGRGGADVVSGMAAGFAIANLFFVSFGGTTTATSVIMGSTLGAGELETARMQKRWILSGSVIIGIVMLLFGMATTLIVPVVFGRLSASAIHICKDMVILNASFIPLWLFMNCQLAISRAGGDTAMGAVADALITVFVMLPTLFLLAALTNMGPVMLYLCVKLIDVGRVVIFQIWLGRERWLRNLTVGA